MESFLETPSLEDITDDVPEFKLNDQLNELAEDSTEDNIVAASNEILEQFITDIESIPALTTTADLYLKYHQYNKGAPSYSSSISYIDEMDEEYSLTPSSNKYKTSPGSNDYGYGSGYSCERSYESSYGKNYGKSYDYSSKPKYKTNYYSTDEEDLQESVGKLAENLDVIYDCVKGIDQLLTDVHEREVVTSDNVDAIQLRLSTIEDNQLMLENMLKSVTRVVNSIYNDIHQIRVDKK